MKKIYLMFLTLVSSVIFAFTALAHGAEETIINQFEKEVVVEVSSEEEFLNYPMNPDYKYTFLFPVDVKRRTICYNCGQPYLGLGTEREQSTTITVGCPGNQYAPDIFYTWNNWNVERCTACGMSNRISKKADTYSSWCYDMQRDWEVKKSYTLAGGYDLHQVYDYWVNPSDYMNLN